MHARFHLKRQIKKQTKIADVICTEKKLKRNWVVHFTKRNDDRWTTKILYWLAGCRFKDGCLTRDLGLWVECPL